MNLNSNAMELTIILLVSYQIRSDSINIFLAAHPKYKVIVVDLQKLPIIRLKKSPRMEVPLSDKYELYEPHSYLECHKKLSMFKNAIYIKLYQDDIFDILIRLLIIGKTVITWNTFSSYLLLNNRAKNINLVTLFDKFFYYFNRIFDTIFTRNILFTNNQHIPFGFSKVIRVNNDIYDEFLDYLSLKKPKNFSFENKDKVGLVLGNNIFEHYDHIKDGGKKLEFSQFYQEIKKLINLLEGESEVLIFLHPKTCIKKAQKLLGNHEFKLKVNYKEIENCSLVLGYTSTALIYPLLLNKPVGIITSDIFKNSIWLTEVINWHLKIFGVDPINISSHISLVEINNKSNVNNSARSIYIDNHLCFNPKLRNQDILMNEIDARV